MNADDFFTDWPGTLKPLVLGLLAYPALVLMLRISGKRTLAKMNAFDFVITVALGSSLASILTTGSVPLAQGLVALLTLILLQFVVTFTSVRSTRLRRFIRAEPALLFHSGQFQDAVMRHERVTRDEIESAVRGAGLASMVETQAVLLEPDGSMHVIPAVRTAFSTDRPARGPRPRPETADVAPRRH